MTHDHDIASAPRKKGHPRIAKGHRHRRALGGAALRHRLLEMIAEEPRQGYEIAAALAERRGGQPVPGALYPALEALEAEGLISARPAAGRRKRCRITPSGRAALGRGPGKGHGLQGELSEAMALLKAALRRTEPGSPAAADAAAAITAAAEAIGRLAPGAAETGPAEDGGRER
ncbi:PadR family transcriptional regulator [Poseidonocella sp. HB161398]|uniref:PadR family transcriptional regulator n=1 Tax=Poseidonocella sp. HB161398 TaxID=2320855 RepID=UPI001109EAFB|nr:PadR family transcriptional regulator [Poseidonocella sp. HB161398]